MMLLLFACEALAKLHTIDVSTLRNDRLVYWLQPVRPQQPAHQSTFFALSPVASPSFSICLVDRLDCRHNTAAHMGFQIGPKFFLFSTSAGFI
jgi:hypothetical protein